MMVTISFLYTALSKYIKLIINSKINAKATTTWLTTTSKSSHPTSQHPHKNKTFPSQERQISVSLTYLEFSQRNTLLRLRHRYRFLVSCLSYPSLCMLQHKNVPVQKERKLIIITSNSAVHLICIKILTYLSDEVKTKKCCKWD